MALALHCDNESCDSWQPVDTELPTDWLAVVPDDKRDNELGTFCCLDCVTVWAAAHSEPTEEVS